MKEAEVLAIVTEVIHDTFLVDLPIERATVASDVPGWDSLSTTILTLSLEERFKVSLHNMASFINVGEMVDSICAQKKS
jgi:acyl carrier protein